MNPKYIKPIIKIYATFNEAKEFYDKFGGITLFDDEDKKLEVSDLAQGTRNLIVGEPGVGKSLLVEKIQGHFDTQKHLTSLVKLRQADAIQQIDSFIQKKSKKQKVLLLDGLDEVQSSSFPAILQKIEEIASKYPTLPIYLSSRWIFISKHSTSFPGFRFITIPPFTNGQVREYLLAAGHSDADISELQIRIMSFSHRMLVIQIPRYLYYLEDFLQKKGLDAAAKVSRNELFEHFIYSKLEHEDIKLNSNRRAITKRVLEKIALTMEIYQTNTISKDDLMTFFDEFKSDLKMVALSQIDLEIFFECSLLKNNVDSIEFDNSEFQEYLAAKEISRFPDPNQAAFGFAVDSDAKEIYSTWFNTLTFLIDMQPDLLEQLVEFSGIRGSEFKIMDDSFLTFLSRIDAKKLPVDLKRELFKIVIEYHNTKKQWMPGQLTSALPGFFDDLLESLLKSWATEAKTKSGSNRFVPLGNVAYVVAYLLKSRISLDTVFWRKELLEYTSDKNENGVLQRHALLALTELKDPTIIDEVPDLTNADNLISHEFLSMCRELDADNPKSVEYFFDAVRQNNFYGRYGIFAFKKQESIKKFLEIYSTDENFLKEFLDDSRIFEDKDYQIIESIEKNLNDEIIELSKKAIEQSVAGPFWYNSRGSVFVMQLWKLIRRHDPGFVLDMVNRLKNSEAGKTGLYFAHDFFAEVIQKEDVFDYIDAMISAGERNSAFSVMLGIKRSGKEGSEELYEMGRSKLLTEYQEWENRPITPNTTEDDRTKEILKEFRTLLEPVPKQYSTNVFDFYNHNKDRLDPIMSKDDKDRLAELITGTVFKFIDPIKQNFEITDDHNGSRSYTTTTGIHMFGEALKAAKSLGINVSSFRQNILDFIPFAYHGELEAIFELVKDITQQEMDPVIQIYKDKKSDLWRHQPGSFVQAVEQYHVVEAVPVLKELVKEDKCDKYARQSAISVIDTLAPDIEFLKEIFQKYKDHIDPEEKKLSQIAIGLLITNHSDRDSIRARIQEILNRAAGFIRPSGVHNVGELEGEIEHGKTFAKPLMDLKYPGYEEEYLALLNEAIKIWARGPEFQAYATYIWEIVYSYFDNLKEGRTYTPLRLIEKKIAALQDQEGANWLASRMVHLRRSYLGYLGKPRNVSEAIKKYNDARERDNKKILNSDDLFQHLKDGLETDLRKWIEGEGAYELIIGEKVYTGKRQEYEKLIQKTLKTQVENILLRRGFHAETLREAELLDGKKGDFLVRYGFVGPVVIEVKLTSNTDLKAADLTESLSYKSMGRYMGGYSATHGIFLVVNNTEATNLKEIKEAFQKIRNVWVQSFDCSKKGLIVNKSSTKVIEKKSIKRTFQPAKKVGLKKKGM